MGSSSERYFANNMFPPGRICTTKAARFHRLPTMTGKKKKKGDSSLYRPHFLMAVQGAIMQFLEENNDL